MKIYESTEYVDDSVNEFYKLSVINMWDFTSKACCYDERTRYRLEKHVRESEYGVNTTKYHIVKSLSNEMIECLISMGYEISERFLYDS